MCASELGRSVCCLISAMYELGITPEFAQAVSRLLALKARPSSSTKSSANLPEDPIYAEDRKAPTSAIRKAFILSASCSASAGLG